MGKAKYLEVARRLEQRIQQGDYNLQHLPSERKLANETGVSTMTLRKALRKLLEDGLLVRQPGGRLRTATPSESPKDWCQLAMLAPAFESPEVGFWQIALAKAAGDCNCSLRMVYYAHWDDPVIRNTLHGFAGTFLAPLVAPPPAALLQELSAPERALVVVDNNWSEHGLPSLQLYPATGVQRVLDHLYAIGCRRIACFNTQPEDGVILERIRQWKLWMTRHRLEGPLLHRPVRPFLDTLDAAYEAALEVLRKRPRDVDAFCCLTEAAALGVSRAAADCGLQVGKDMALCSVHGQLLRYTTPSITALARPDVSAVALLCVRWMRQAAREAWTGPLLLEPEEMKLEVRESTDHWRPATAAKATPRQK